MDTEAELRSIWNEKVRRFSGGEENQEEQLARFSQIWDTILPRIQPKDSLDYLEMDALLAQDAQAFHSLNDKDIIRTAVVNAFDAMRQKKGVLSNVIDQHISNWKESGDIADFIPVFNELSRWRSLWLSPFDRPGQPLPEDARVGFNTLLFYVLPPSFPDALTATLEATLDQPMSENDSLLELLASFGITKNFETLICRVSYRNIEKRVSETCPEKWDEPCLKDLLEWVRAELAPRTAHIYSFDPDMKSSPYAGDRNISQKFEFHVSKTLCDLRISELFKIISNVEPNAAVLIDIRECGIRISSRAEIIHGLRNQVSKRLLHPGADTSDIIDFYISMIKCLRVIDPQGVLLYRTADPIRTYLRTRPDTIKLIVQRLIDEKSDLAMEAQAAIVPEMEHEDYSDPQWMPEPPEAGPKFRTMRPTDLISTLVSIYNSQDLFIKELQTLFATLLLQSRDATFETEKRQIEILKLRFGDAALQGPDVMLSDMQTSSRVNKLIFDRQEMEDPTMVPAVVSRWFWPPPPEMDKFKMPGRYAQHQAAYSKLYEEQKPDKRLHWVPQLGSVTLTIELKDRTLSEITVSPLEAAVIELFSQNPRWSAAALCETLGIKEKTLLPALVSWSERGVIKSHEHLRHWILIEKEDNSSPPTYVPVSPQMEFSSPKARDLGGSDREQQHRKAITTMLSNFRGGLMTSVVTSMLKYSPNPPNAEEVDGLLKRLEKDNVVEQIEGVWRLV